VTTLPNQVRAAKARRRRKLAARHGPAWVDPAPAREHIARLQADHGISLAAVGRLAGIQTSMVEHLCNPGHSQYRRWITRDTARRILDARFDLDQLDDRMQIDVIGTQRRIRALCRVGWSQILIAERLGISPKAVGFYLNPNRRYVTARVARSIRDLYAELESRRGPSETSARWAASRGWPPPIAWDDDTIDHPDTRPDVSCLVRPSTRAAGDVLDDVRWVLAHEPHLTKAQVATRLRMEPDAVSAALTRAADAARSAVLAGAPFGPVTRDLHDRATAAAEAVLIVRDQMTDNAVAAGHNVTRRRRKDDAA
jgi:hypothetical protein